MTPQQTAHLGQLIPDHVLPLVHGDDVVEEHHSRRRVAADGCAVCGLLHARHWTQTPQPRLAHAQQQN